MGRASRYKKRMTSRQKARNEALNCSGHCDRSPEWVADIDPFLDEGASYDTGKLWTIYRIPVNLLEVQRKAYIPKIVSIGPFYYMNPRYTVMDKGHKKRYLLRLLGRAPFRRPEHEADIGVFKGEPDTDEHGKTKRRINLDILHEAMEGMELMARERYAEDFDQISSDDFVRMMILDGCFVIELLRLFYKYDNKEPVDDPIFTTRWMLRTLQRDLLMLENQLPLPVLQYLFDLSSLDENEPPLIQLILTFFNPLLPRDRESLNLSFSKSNISYEHILDVFYSSFLTQMRTPDHKLPNGHGKTTSHTPLTKERQLLHSVQELREVGVLFKVAKNKELLDISFKNGVFDIPPLYIDDNTVPVLLNFLAYEQCDLVAEPYFTDFFIFYDSLINSAKDVDILHTSGIIHHLLGSYKDVANLINRVSREIVFDGINQSYLCNQTIAANDYCRVFYKTKWHSWRTHLVRDYFSSPWTALSLVAAILLLTFTLVQTAYAVIAYHHPTS